MLAEMQTKKKALYTAGPVLIKITMEAPRETNKTSTHDSAVLYPSLHLNDAKTTRHRTLAQ